MRRHIRHFIPRPQVHRERGEVFFQRHGAKTVFFGRWLPVLRFTAAWLAGAHKMDWRRFFFWNALGGICWATSVGLAAYALGSAAKEVVAYAGFGAVAAVLAAALGFYFWRRRRKSVRPAHESTQIPSGAGTRRRAPFVAIRSALPHATVSGAGNCSKPR